MPIVNNLDEIIGHKDRLKVDYQKDIYRVSSLWVDNGRGDVLIAQRAFDKVEAPGCWGPAVAGTVEKGESYQENIQKEAHEEIGVSGVEFRAGPKQLVSHRRTFFNQWFMATIDQPAESFTVQKEEVVGVKWIPLKTLVKDVAKHPESYIPSMPAILRLFDL